MEETVSQRVIRCAFEVSNTLGVGFLEKVYEKALCVEFQKAGLAFECQKVLEVEYKDQIVGNYAADIVVDGRLIVELKALSSLSRQHEAQVMNYLRASDISVGLLLNFGTPRIGIKRIVWQHDESKTI